MTEKGSQRYQVGVNTLVTKCSEPAIRLVPVFQQVGPLDRACSMRCSGEEVPKFTFDLPDLNFRAGTLYLCRIATLGGLLRCLGYCGRSTPLSRSILWVCRPKVILGLHGRQLFGSPEHCVSLYMPHPLIQPAQIPTLGLSSGPIVIKKVRWLPDDVIATPSRSYARGG
jgi:hypothetical protein